MRTPQRQAVCDDGMVASNDIRLSRTADHARRSIVFPDGGHARAHDAACLFGATGHPEDGEEKHDAARALHASGGVRRWQDVAGGDAPDGRRYDAADGWAGPADHSAALLRSGS